MKVLTRQSFLVYRVLRAELFLFLDGNWKTGWEVYFDRWGREGNQILFTANKLEPETGYSFRVIAVNKLGASLASDSTATLKTGMNLMHT